MRVTLRTTDVVAGRELSLNKIRWAFIHVTHFAFEASRLVKNVERSKQAKRSAGTAGNALPPAPCHPVQVQVGRK